MIPSTPAPQNYMHPFLKIGQVRNDTVVIEKAVSLADARTALQDAEALLGVE
jgi:hypothetical protein